MRGVASSAEGPADGKEIPSRFPCGTTSPDGRWRLSRTLLSLRDPYHRHHRLAGLTVPVSGAVNDEGVAVILDRSDPAVGLHRLCVYTGDGRLVRAHRVHGQQVQMGADLARRLVFLLAETRHMHQTLSAHELPTGHRRWQRDLELDRPVLYVSPREGCIQVRHARSPPRLPYVYRFDLAGNMSGHLPEDGRRALLLAEAALALGRTATARTLLEHAREEVSSRDVASRAARLLEDLERPRLLADAGPSPLAPDQDW